MKEHRYNFVGNKVIKNLKSAIAKQLSQDRLFRPGEQDFVKE
jgi:hypothetical protein